MINWKLRLKNKTTLATLIVVGVSFIYTILGAIGIVPSVTGATVTDILLSLVEILVTLGIVVDPTTEGVKDSRQAMKYEQPKVDVKEGE